MLIVLALGLLALTTAICARLRWDHSCMEWQTYAVWLALGIGCTGSFLLCRLYPGLTAVKIIAGIVTAAVLLLLLWTEGMPWFLPKADGTEQLLLVSGAPVLYGKATDNLNARADCAAQWMASHPDTKAILSGGKSIPTEAALMQQRMQLRGISAERLCPEERSTTTTENFLFSREILQQQSYQPGQPLIVVTNRFHIYRLSCYARQLGFSNLRFCIAPTPPVTELIWLMREMILVVRFWILKI